MVPQILEIVFPFTIENSFLGKKFVFHLVQKYLVGDGERVGLLGDGTHQPGMFILVVTCRRKGFMGSHLGTHIHFYPLVRSCKKLVG